MKLNKLSLSLAITLALGSTFGMAHAETTGCTQNPKYLMLLQKLILQLKLMLNV